MEKHGSKRKRAAIDASGAHCGRYPKRQPGGYRYKLEHPVDPLSLLGKRVSIRGAEVESWFDGVVKGYSEQDCKHTVDWQDSEMGTPASELRLGLECSAKVDLPEGEEPPRASRAVLENLLGVLQAEEIGTSNVLQQLQDKPMLSAGNRELKRILHTRLEQKRKHIAVVTRMLDNLQAEQDAAAAAAAEAAAAAAAERQRLPKDCPIMRRVGPQLMNKWAQQPSAAAGGVPAGCQHWHEEQQEGEQELLGSPQHQHVQEGGAASDAGAADAGPVEQPPLPAVEQAEAAAGQAGGTSSLQQQGVVLEHAAGEPAQQHPAAQPQPQQSTPPRRRRMGMRELLAVTQSVSPSEKQATLQRLLAPGASRATRQQQQQQGRQDGVHLLAAPAAVPDAAAEPAAAAEASADEPAEQQQQQRPAKKQKLQRRSGQQGDEQLQQQQQQEQQQQQQQQRVAGVLQRQRVASARQGRRSNQQRRSVADAEGGGADAAEQQQQGAEPQQAAGVAGSRQTKQHSSRAAAVADQPDAPAPGAGPSLRQQQKQQQDVDVSQQLAVSRNRRGSHRRPPAAFAAAAVAAAAGDAALAEAAGNDGSEQQPGGCVSEQQQGQLRSPLKPLTAVQQQQHSHSSAAGGTAGATAAGHSQPGSQQQQGASVKPRKVPREVYRLTMPAKADLEFARAARSKHSNSSSQATQQQGEQQPQQHQLAAGPAGAGAAAEQQPRDTPQQAGEKQQQQQQAGQEEGLAQAVPSAELLQLDPSWSTRRAYSRNKAATQQQQQQEQQAQQQEQQPEPTCADHQQPPPPEVPELLPPALPQQQSQQQQQHAEEASRVSKLPRELQQLLAAAADEDQPPTSRTRRPSSMHSKAHAHSTAATAASTAAGGADQCGPSHEATAIMQGPAVQSGAQAGAAGDAGRSGSQQQGAAAVPHTGSQPAAVGEVAPLQQRHSKQQSHQQQQHSEVRSQQRQRQQQKDGLSTGQTAAAAAAAPARLPGKHACSTSAARGARQRPQLGHEVSSSAVRSAEAFAAAAAAAVAALQAPRTAGADGQGGLPPSKPCSKHMQPRPAAGVPGGGKHQAQQQDAQQQRDVRQQQQLHQQQQQQEGDAQQQVPELQLAAMEVQQPEVDQLQAAAAAPPPVPVDSTAAAAATAEASQVAGPEPPAVLAAHRSKQQPARQQQHQHLQQPEEQLLQKAAAAGRPSSRSAAAAPAAASTGTAAGAAGPAPTALQATAAAATPAASAPAAAGQAAGAAASSGSAGTAVTAGVSAGAGPGAAGFVSSKAAIQAASKLLNDGRINPANIPGLEFTQVEWVVQQLGSCETLPEAQQRLDAAQQGPEGQQQGGGRLDLLVLDQELEDALAAHADTRASHTTFRELDVSMRVSPEALVNRQLRVFWEIDDAWFAGSVVAWDPKSARHQVVYVDGETDWVFMGVERVRLLITAGEELPRPDAVTLQQLAQRYSEQARVLEQKLAKQQSKGCTPDDEELAVPFKLRQKAEALLGAAYVKARQAPPETWLVKKPAVTGAGGNAGGKKGPGKRKSTHGARRASVPAPAGPRAANTLMELTDAADPALAEQRQGVAAAGKRKAGPEQQQGGAAKRCRVAKQLTSSGQQDHQQQLQQQQQQPATVPQQAPGSSLLKQALHNQATQHQQDAASRDCSPAAAAAAAAAAAGREDSPGVPGAEGGGSSSGGTETFSVQVGEVVWVERKPNPPWPCLVISHEEATDFSVEFTHRSTPQVAVQFFGDYTRMRVSVASLIPPKVALKQRLWLPTVACINRKAEWVKMVKIYTIGLREFIRYCKTGDLPDSEMVPEHNDERWMDEDREHERGAAAAAGAASKKKQKQGAGAAAAIDPSIPTEDLMRLAREFVSAVTAAAPGRGSGSSSSKHRLPLQVAKGLRLVALGRVDYLHPHFHNDKFIFPAGFTVERRAKTPCSGDREVWHRAEILSNPDGSGPLFRVTPEGGAAVTGTTPTAAWQELYKNAPPVEGLSAKASAAAVAARAASVCGPRLFGLQHPLIHAIIESLPDAAYCDRFLAWKGTPPVPPPLTPEVQLARRLISAELSKLPPGVLPRRINRRGKDLCDSCGEDQEVNGNHMLECDGCGLLVHMGCYGVQRHPHGDPWMCDTCCLQHQPQGPLLSQPPACSLCPCIGGVMKPTTEGGWCHLLCASWTPGVTVGDDERMEPIVGTQRATKARAGLTCKVCRQSYGACIQCAHDKCREAFHATCARAAGWPMLMVDDPDSDSEGEEGGEEQPPAAAERQRQQQQPQEQQQAAQPLHRPQQQLGGGQQQQQPQQPGGQLAQQQQQGQAGGPGPGPARLGPGKAGRSKSRKSSRRGGTLAGDNCRLVCYCPRHRALAEGLQGVRLHNRGTTPHTRLQRPCSSAIAAAAAAGGSDSHAAEATPSREPSPAAAEAVGAAGAGTAAAASCGARNSSGSGSRASSSQPPPAPAAGPALPSRRRGRREGVMLHGPSQAAPEGTSARSRPWDVSSRRHMKAPDQLAVSMRKRLYMQATPHLVTGRSGTVRQQLRRPPPASRLWTAAQYDQQQLLQQQRQAAAAAGAAGGGSRGDGGCVLQLLQERLLAAQQLQVAARVAGGEGGPAGRCGGGGGVPLSQAERYQQMVRTVNDRLCTGKSAIHGTGVFLKRPHKAGDYIIEYQGSLVRPLVTDQLERTVYNGIVGSGTYIFTLNDEFSVDATRAGNMAHLINHSCAPVAYSRIITVRDPGSGELRDHVVIIAARDLGAGVEATYDYRFNGDDQLRCNCGAPTCRGWVNLPKEEQIRKSADDNVLLVPRGQLVVLRGAAAAAAACPPTC